MTVSICAGPNRSTGVLPRSRSSHHPRRVATTCHPATENTSVERHGGHEAESPPSDRGRPRNDCRRQPWFFQKAIDLCFI
ncbi:hypothetical protein Ae505Ps2_4284c [Pseudonocardia sp. Ae505_Ps2]|nr:hypothetical protein Ae505Ps2_4284c [Pseudonocardia sp. Ae505_Ps2]